MQQLSGLFGSVPFANGNPFTGILNLILAVVLGAFGKQSIFWVRDYERGSMTKRTGMVKNKDGSIRIFKPGVYLRPAWIYTMARTSIRIRVDDIIVKVMRPTPTGTYEKWEYAATARWYVDETGEYPYLACEWIINDLGKFARAVIQDTILAYLEGNPVAATLDTIGIFKACEPKAQSKLLQHGVIWTELMANDNSLADAEIQAGAIRQVVIQPLS